MSWIFKTSTQDIQNIVEKYIVEYIYIIQRYYIQNMFHVQDKLLNIITLNIIIFKSTRTQRIFDIMPLKSWNRNERHVFLHGIPTTFQKRFEFGHTFFISLYFPLGFVHFINHDDQFVYTQSLGQHRVFSGLSTCGYRWWLNSLSNIHSNPIFNIHPIIQ